MSGPLADNEMEVGSEGLNLDSGGTSTPNTEKNKDQIQKNVSKKDGKKTKKRKVNESLDLDTLDESFTDDQLSEIKEAVKKVSDVIDGIYEKVIDYSKMRSDIKEEMDELQSLNKLLLKETVLRLLNEGKKIRVNVEDETDAEENEEEIEKVNLKTTDIKKYFCDRCSIEIERQEEDKKEIIEKIKSGSQLSEENFLKLMEKKWPNDVYVKTKVVTGNPLNTKCKELILFYEDKEEDTTLMKLLKEKFPETDDILAEEGEEGETPFIENIVNTRKGSTKTKIYFAKIGKYLDVKKKILDCKTQMESRDVRNLAAAVSQAGKRENMRKIIEMIFTDWNSEIEFYVPRSDIGKRRERNEAVVIGTDISSYAETLKNIRAVVNPEELGIEIKTVKTTRDHRVIIETEVGQAEALHREIAAKVKGVQTKVSGKSANITLIILDIDASMNGKEVEYYIRKNTKIYETEVKSIRIGKNGTQIATVSMPKQGAEDLLTEGDIKIGWTRCRVKQKIDLLRCYNCLKFGHHSDICKDGKSEKRCLNCTKVGHLIKDCENASFCATCNREGHKTDSNLCPSYRSLIQATTLNSRIIREIAKEKETKEADINTDQHMEDILEGEQKD